jgi:archaellum component FlaC
VFIIFAQKVFTLILIGIFDNIEYCIVFGINSSTLEIFCNMNTMADKKNHSDKNLNNEKHSENVSSPSSLDDRKYQNADIKGKLPNAPTPEQEKEMQKVREQIEELKKKILDKIKFVILQKDKF